MRRAGKTCFLHQQRAERIAKGKAPEQMIYLNFEDERLAGLSEIATSMRGRGWELPIHPFSFREYLRYHGHEPMKSTDYLTRGKQVVMDGRFAD